MPSASFAAGVLGGYFNRLRAERDRREQTALDVANFLIATQRVKKPEDLYPFLDVLREGSLLGSFRKGKASGGGGAGAGAQGKGDDLFPPVLSALIGTGLGQQPQTQPQPQSQGQSQGQSAPLSPTGPPGAAPGLLPSPGAAPAPQRPRTGALGGIPDPRSVGMYSDEDLLRKRIGEEQTVARAQAQFQTEQEEQAFKTWHDRLLARGFSEQEATFYATELASRQTLSRGLGRMVNVGRTTGDKLPAGTIDQNTGEEVDHEPTASYMTREDPVTREREYYSVTATGAGRAAYGTGPLGNLAQARAWLTDPDPVKRAAGEQFLKTQAENAQEKLQTTMLRIQEALLRIQTGKENKANEDELAEAGVEGYLPLDLLPGFGQGRKTVMGKMNRLWLARTGKPFNFAASQLRWLAAKRAVQTLGAPQTQRFLADADSVVNTISEVKRLGAELKQTSVQKWNDAKRSTLLQLFAGPNQQKAAQYLEAISALKSEVATLIRGGYAPTEEAFQTAATMVNADFAPAVLDAQLDEAKLLVNYRVKATVDRLEALGAPAASPAGGAGTGAGGAGGAGGGQGQVQDWEIGPDGKLHPKPRQQ